MAFLWSWKVMFIVPDYAQLRWIVAWLVVCVPIMFVAWSLLLGIARIGWSDLVGSLKIRDATLTIGSANSFSELIELSRLRWLGYVIYIKHSFTLACLTFRSSQWVKEATWRSMDACGIKKCATIFGHVVASALRGWSPKDPSTSWLETLNYIAANREQLGLCCHFQSKWL